VLSQAHGVARLGCMDQDRPSIPEVLTYVGGLGFVIGTVLMAAFPFAVAGLVFGLLLLPLLLPVLLLGMLYGLFVLVRRLVAALGRRVASARRVPRQRHARQVRARRRFGTARRPLA